MFRAVHIISWQQAAQHTILSKACFPPLFISRCLPSVPCRARTVFNLWKKWVNVVNCHALKHQKGLSPSECVMVSISHWLQTIRSEIMWRALSDAAIFVKEGVPKSSGSSSELWDIKKKNFWMWRSPKAQRPLWLPEERCVPQTTCWGLRKADLGVLEGGMGLGKATWRAKVPPAPPKQELSRGGESRWDYFQQVRSLG